MTTQNSIVRLVLAAGALTAGLAFALPPQGNSQAAKGQKPLFQDVRAQTKQFIALPTSTGCEPPS